MNFKNPKTKDKIIIILKDKRSLNAKQIYNSLRQTGWKKTYQAVHKILKEMISEEIISRKDNRYHLSKRWLSNLASFLYDEKLKYEKIGSMTIYSFNSIAEMDRFIFSFSKDMDKRLGSDDKVIWQAKHYWWPIAYSKEMYETMVSRENQHISEKIFTCQEPLDRWCENYYKNLGVKTTRKKRFDKDYIAYFKETSIEIVIPKKMQERIDSFFSKVRFEDIDLKRFYRTIINKRSKIRIIKN